MEEAGFDLGGDGVAGNDRDPQVEADQALDDLQAAQFHQPGWAEAGPGEHLLQQEPAVAAALQEQEGIVGQHLQGYPMRAGQGMVRVADRHILAPE